MSSLFVYGTLLRGEERDGFVSHLEARPASITGRLWRVPAGYPALELPPNGVPIKGEVLQLDNPSILVALDLIEGVSQGLYERKQVQVQTAQGHQSAWVYVMNPSQLRQSGCVLLKGNDWRRYSRRK